jgi:hypothetical protein
MPINLVEVNSSLYTTVKEARSEYDLDVVISKVAVVGGKTALWIGRMACEKLPEDEGMTWVSGDLMFAEQPFSRNRLHIHMDFSKEEMCKKLEGLFDLVVIDQSTVKGIRGDFIARFTRFLKPGAESKFIFEACPYICAYSNKIEKPMNNFGSLSLPSSVMSAEREFKDRLFDKYLEKHSFRPNDLKEKGYAAYQAFLKEAANHLKETGHKDYEAFVKEVSEDYVKDMGERWLPAFQSYIIEKLKKEGGMTSPQQQACIDAREDTYEHIKNYFHNVEFFKDTDYPYPTNFNNREFYIATAPKG